MGLLDDAIAQEAQAREALVTEWGKLAWNYWVRLEWSSPVSAVTANDHLERLLRDLHRKFPHIRLVAGFHRDPQPHAHALVRLNVKLRAQFLSADEFREWLRPFWYHGPLWAEPFDSTRQQSHGSAVAYLARDPGSVVFG